MKTNTPDTLVAPAQPITASTSAEASERDALEKTIIFSRYGALLTAWVAMGGSLFLSDVMGLVPCVLCWYQRILMYPLTILLAVGILRHDRSMHMYVLPFSLAGTGLALYHYLLLRTDWLPTPNCSVGIPCNIQYFNILGFINIPLMSLIAFAIISLAMAVNTLRAEDSSDAEDMPNIQRLPTILAVGGIIAAVVLAFIIGAAQW